MKTGIRILVLIAIDFAAIWLWICQMDPDPSVSIGIFLVVLIVFGFNLFIAGSLYLLEKKKYVSLFLVNAVISSIITAILFERGITRHQNNTLESWTFKKADTIFSVTRWKKISEFTMSYSISPGSSWQFLKGKCESKNNEFVLTTDSTEYRIKNNYLIGFRMLTDTIPLLE